MLDKLKIARKKEEAFLIACETILVELLENPLSFLKKDLSFLFSSQSTYVDFLIKHNLINYVQDLVILKFQEELRNLTKNSVLEFYCPKKWGSKELFNIKCSDVWIQININEKTFLCFSKEKELSHSNSLNFSDESSIIIDLLTNSLYVEGVKLFGRTKLKT